MPAHDELTFAFGHAIAARNAGLAVTRGIGTHPTRVIDSHELIFVREGTLWMFEQEAEFRVDAGGALHLWPGRRHGGVRPYDEDLVFYWIHFHVGRQRAARGEGVVVRVPSCTKVTRPDHLTELFRRFLDDQESGWLTRPAADLLVLLMLTEVADMRPGEPGRLQGPEALAARARDYIRSRLSSEISAADVAASLRCNPDYLGRVYRRAYGLGLTDAIHQLRVHKARRLLLEGAMNVDEVARACGFADAGYFRRIFRRHERMSPRAYRGLYGRVHVNVL